MKYSPLSQEITAEFRSKDPLDLAGDMPKVLLGYDCGGSRCRGSIFIAERDFSGRKTYTLDGYNDDTEGKAIGFIRAMKKIIADYDAIKSDALYIFRDTRRTDLTEIFAKFGFRLIETMPKINTFVYLRVKR